jgi:serine/threonine protein kinase
MESTEIIGGKGRYMLLKLLARGGMAEIWLARKADGTDAGHVVIKRLHPYLREEKKYRDMFLDEARISSRLDHANIVTTREVGTYKGDQFLVMEYLDGVSLGHLINAALDRKIHVPPRLIAGIMAAVCDGLEYAHTMKDEAGKPLNIVHRDVSPPNIIVLFSGEVKLVDFGVARAEDRVHKTATGMMKGKVSYMSPEQCYGKHLDARSDVFSLGIVFWEVLACRHLFKRKSEIETLKSIVTDEPVPVRTYNQEVKSALSTIVMKALEKDAQDRFQTARHMGAAIRKYLKKTKAPDFKADIQSFLSAVLPDHEEGRRRMLEEFESPPDEAVREQAFIEVTKEAPQAKPPAKPPAEPPAEPAEALFGMSWTEELDVPTQEFLLDKKKPRTKTEPVGPEQFVLGVRTDEDKDELDVATDRLKFEDVLLEELAAEEQRPITLYPKSPLKTRHPVVRMFFLLLLLGLTLATYWLVSTHGVDLYSFVSSFEDNESTLEPTVEPEPVPAAERSGAAPVGVPETKPVPEKVADPAPETKPPPRPPKAKSPPAAKPTRYGFLQVNSTPWTEVYIDERDVGFTPVVKYKLPVGEHEVRLINEGYQIDVAFEVVIEEDETYNVLKNFTK